VINVLDLLEQFKLIDLDFSHKLLVSCPPYRG
jgi:hypothetical protein